MSLESSALSQSPLFGIVGAYGATGKAVVSELLKSGDGELLVGGRDPARLRALPAESGGRISAAPVDVLDVRSLDDFCGRCSVVVNCAGPVILLKDRVAQAAFRAGCHYVDPAGMSVVKEGILSHNREIEDLGLSFVVSAGWTPGITELLPVYAHAKARSKMDSVESVSVCFSDSGQWSTNALRDGFAFLHRAGLPRAGYFRRGEWVRAKMWEASRKVGLGDPIGRRRFSLFSMPELDEVGRQLVDCNFFTYSYLSGFQNAVAAIVIAVVPLSEKSGVRLLSSMFRRNRLSLGGFVVVHVVGRCERRIAALKADVSFDAGSDYWMNGVALATVARMVAARKGLPGVRFLSAAVDPADLVFELRKAGVRLVETFEDRR
jgi:saccharopine dehydrogenase (NAD+, L-lysine forming)